MSRIESVKVYQPNFQSNQKKTNFAPYQSFVGGESKVADEASKVTAEASKAAADALDAAVKKYGQNINSTTGWVGKVSNYLYGHDGEVQSQLGNALFTTTLAPVVIAFNPVSKEDSNTKKYSALRQPISAIIAIAFGLGVTMPNNNFMEMIASKGYFESFDLRMKPNENYLKRQYKKEYKLAEKNGTLEQFKETHTPKDWKEPFGVDAYVKYKQDAAQATFKKLLLENPEVLRNDANLQKEIENLDKFISKNNLNEVDFKTFMRDNFKIEFSEQTGELREEAFEKRLGEIKAMDFLRKLGLIKSDFDKKTGLYPEGHCTEDMLERFLARHREEKSKNNMFESAPEITTRYKNAMKTLRNNNLIGENFGEEKIDMLKKIILYPEENGLQSILEDATISSEKERGERVVKYLRDKGLVNDNFKVKHLKKFLSLEPYEELKQFMDDHNSIRERIGQEVKDRGVEIARPIKRSFKTKEETILLSEMVEALDIEGKVKEYINGEKKLINVLNEFIQKHLKGLEVEQIGKEKFILIEKKKITDIAGQIIKNMTKRAESDFKNIKKWSGLAVALATLPFSCGLLNWAYPRIMEKYFPNLAKSKAQKGGNK